MRSVWRAPCGGGSSAATVGPATDEVATRLTISRHTVRDHVKAIFAKAGVSSRPELTALVTGGD